MEEDDEFGDLYTDVLRPRTTSFRSRHQETDVPVPTSYSTQPDSRRIDLNTKGNDIRTSDMKNVLSSHNSSIGVKISPPIQDSSITGLESRPEARRFDLNLDSNEEVTVIASLAGSSSNNALELKDRALAKGGWTNLREKAREFSFMEEDDDIDIVVEERDDNDVDLVEKDNNIIDPKKHPYISADRKDNTINVIGESMLQHTGLGQKIPGFSERLENQGDASFEEEWESEDSEDDLQIVLNDDTHGPIGMERMPGMHDEDDEDGEPLVILADNGDASHHLHQQNIVMTEEQEWGGEEGGPGADGEKKDLGDTFKASGAGATATLAAVQPRIGYSNHMYQHPFHSQFKYVRPGAPPLPGASPMTPGGIPGQVRPPVTVGPVSGRGRGDWRPAGLKGAVPMQKGLHSAYGTSTWGANSAGRGYGSGLDFTLPSHKTIFEVDINSFEDKPWNFPGIDKSDFFNFGLNEESWKGYCKQLDQFRLETTMQSKIRVYESGRAEQDYDPDLPPELAAAVGIQDIPSENANPGDPDAAPIDLTRECALERPPPPVGRPIPVETGSGERLPSVDTRRLRMHDAGAIIEIVCQSSRDDDMEEHQETDPAMENLEHGDEVDDCRVAKGAQLKNIVGDDVSVRNDVTSFPSEVSARDHSDRDFVDSFKRRPEGKDHARSSKMSASDAGREKEIVDYHNEDSFDSGNGKQSPFSNSHAIGSEVKQVTDDKNDKSVRDDKSFDDETNIMALDSTMKNMLADKYLMHSAEEKEKASSFGEQLSQENDSGKDPKGVKSSESSKARSASSKDHSKDHLEFHDSFEDEVLQEKLPPSSGNIKRPGDEDNAHRKSQREKVETERYHLAMKGKEDSYSRRGMDSDSSHHWHVKSGSLDWRKETDVSEGSWQRRDEDLHGRSIDTTKREHGRETGSRSRDKARESHHSEKDEHKQSRKQLDNGSWRLAYQDQEIGSREKDRDDYLKARNEKVDGFHSRRRKEDTCISREPTEKEGLSYNYRESNSRRKRERDDGSDQWKRDDHARLKDGSMRNVRQKEELFQRERNERQKERDEWHRLKQSHEEVSSRRENKETHPAMRSGRVPEEKTWMNNSRGKDEYRGSSREYHLEDVGRHSDQPKRRVRVENESFSLLKDHENVYGRGNEFSNDEKRARPERSDPRNEQDASRTREHKHKESDRKNRESKSGEHRSLIPSKMTYGDHSGHVSKTVNFRGKIEQETSKNETTINHQSSGKHREEASSEDELPDAKRGRSKFERWTSHKERDFYIASMASSSLNSKDPDALDSKRASLVNGLPEETSKKVDEKLHPSVDDKDAGTEMNDSKAKVMGDKHLDTVEKLKKRSERFKLPMPGEKDTIKKTENEPSNSIQTEKPPDSEIKSERPTRKRRWTGN